MDPPHLNLVVHVGMQIPGPRGTVAEPLTAGPGNGLSANSPGWF